MMTNRNYLAVLFCRVVALVLCMSLATGCTTLKPVTPIEPQSILGQVKPGDELILTTRDGRIREFKVKEANTHQLVGESEAVNVSDITNIERREFSFWKTGSLLVATFLTFVIIMGSIAVNSMGP
jgi:hypothetical protein